MPMPAAEPEFLPALDIPEPGSQRRWTVLLRMLLLLPQYIVLWVLSVIAFVVAVIGWFGALFTGRLPDFAAGFLRGYLEYDTRVYAYLMLTVDRYPPFSFEEPGHPVRVEVRPGPLNRLAVFFRLVLAVPAAIVQSVLSAGWWAVCFISWLVVLILGRMPRPLFEATAAVLRYRMRFQAYFLMLSSAYPKRIFGDPEKEQPFTSATRPLVMSSSGKALLVVFIVLGVAATVASSVTGSIDHDDDYDDNPTVRVTGPLVPGR
ncbi:DUF4389 domain-containing protein [Kitasatospora terrestris]